MSRAFVKEQDDNPVFEEWPDRPISPHRNLVTPEGLAKIEAEVERLRDVLAEAQSRPDPDRNTISRVMRDLRYWGARRSSAEVVPPATSTEQVRFGHKVTIEREDGRRQTFAIVGEDEADPSHGLISHGSPLARTMVGKQVGDVIVAGQSKAEIVAIE